MKNPHKAGYSKRERGGGLLADGFAGTLQRPQIPEVLNRKA
jgi:hypothetical protein